SDLGLAFQIVDDVLDVEGTSAQLGKTTGKDAAAAKPTYPSLYGLEASRALAMEYADRARHVLADAGLMSSHLPGILEWVVSRRGAQILDAARLELVAPDHPYVSRGGVKLAHALDTFGIDVTGRRALDVGASTGGFTDVLLRRGAASVIALDVGHGQLAWPLRTDPRVVVREGVNARHLTPDDVPHAVSVVTIDVAFISLRLILPSLPPFLEPGGDIVALVKPQFEAGREEVGKH